LFKISERSYHGIGHEGYYSKHTLFKWAKRLPFQSGVAGDSLILLLKQLCIFLHLFPLLPSSTLLSNLQIMDLREVVNTTGTTTRYRALLTDGVGTLLAM
jgi:hypothetical protein